MDKKERKSIAPEEYGDLPNEKRCKNCWRLLSYYENETGVSSLWCMHCQKFYKADKEKE